jgi:hypothetical protein
MGCRIFTCDSITKASAAFLAWNVGILRGDICCVGRGLDFSQPRSRSGAERFTCPIDFYDNSIIH